MKRQGFWWSAQGLWLRSRLLLAMAAVIAAMPLLAGLAGLGWQSLAALWAAFVMVRVLTHPALLPREAGDSRKFARDVGAQAFMVGFFYAIGVTISAVTGWAPAIHPFLPALLALMAGMASRTLWDPVPPEMDAVLDEALQRFDAPGGDAAPEGYPTLDPDLVPIAELPEDTPDEAAAARVHAAMEKHLPHWHDTTDRLIHLLEATPGARAGRRGLILWGTDPEVIASGRFGHPLRAAFEVTWADPAMLALFAPRALAAIRAAPGRWAELPASGAVSMAIDAANAPETNETLAVLADTIRAATPPEFRDEAEQER